MPFAFDINKISILHSIVDLVGLVYVTAWNLQILVACLIFGVMILNAWQSTYSFVRDKIHGIKKFSIGLFHSSLQLLPFSLSLAYYDSNDVFMNALFITICLSFAVIIYFDSKKMNNDSDNNTRIHEIFCLCIILDYVNALSMILCKLYTTNNYYFYKFILSSYPFCIGLSFAICNWEYMNWLRIIKRRNFETLRKFGIGLWFLFILVILYPVGMECANACWIIFIYFEFLTKLRHSRRFDESLKDDLVGWLNEHKNDLLTKICIINHVQLVSHRNNDEVALYLYLQHHCENNKFYKNVCWNAFKNKSQKFKNRNLAKTVIEALAEYSRIHRLCGTAMQKWQTFKMNKSTRTFMPFIEKIWEIGSVVLLSFYAVSCVLNVFVWPVITICVMYATLNMHQTGFIILYWLIASVVVYKLYVMIHYERMMWYITPDLSQAKRAQTQTYKKYYKFIKEDFIQFKNILADVLGDDIANIVLLYAPDFY